LFRKATKEQAVFEQRPIYGHIRFSFYGVTDTRLKPNEDDSAMAQLYSETRMARRFFLFENLTLPSLIGQTDRNFTTIFMSSDVMPDRYKERLSTLASRLPGSEVVFSSERRGERAFRPFMAAAAGAGGLGSSVHFRLDDDDALAVSYIARLRRISQSVSPRTHITFPTGILLFPSAPGTSEGVSMVMQQFLLSMGLATVNGQGFHKNPFQMMHGAVWRRWPVVSEPRFPAFIRTQHPENDTLHNQDKNLAVIRRERFSRRSRRHSAAVDDALAAEFPFMNRERLDGLLARCHAIKGLDDLDPLG
jgi:hypothetical protein